MLSVLEEWAIPCLMGLLAGVVIVLFLEAALANHSEGEGAWISKTVDSWCCGPKDCRKVEGRAGPNGWVIQHPFRAGTETVPYGVELKSQDNHFWACFDLDHPAKPIRCASGIDVGSTKTRDRCCLFTPQPGV